LNGFGTKVTIPLEEWVREIATTAARETSKAFMEAFYEHKKEVRIRKEDVDKRIAWLNVRFYLLIGLMIGLGILNVIGLVK